MKGKVLMYIPQYKVLRAVKKGPNGETFFICRKPGGACIGTDLAQVRCFKVSEDEPAQMGLLRSNFEKILMASDPAIAEAFLKVYGADLVGALYSNFEFKKVGLLDE